MASQQKSYLDRLRNFSISTIGFLFEPDESLHSKWVSRGWLGGLYIFGGIVWSYFLNFGRLGFDLHDWTQEGPRFDFIRRSLLLGRLPLHIGSELASTERFLAIPDTVISPQILLLRFLEPGLFILVNSLLLYSLGFLGLLLLRRKFSWSLVPFTTIFLLFSLNGHPLAQVAVGHSMWITYFLLPYLVLLVARLYEGDAGWKWVLAVGVLLFGMYLQGGFHFVNWSIMLLLLIGVTSTEHLGMVLKGILFGLLLSMPRILPAAFEFSNGNRSFISGYFSVTDMVSALISLRPPEEALSGVYSAFGWWEADAYTGLLGLGFLLFFGIYLILRDPETDRISRARILAPILMMTALSLGKIFQPITLLPIPFVDAERVSSRFLVVPIVLLIIVAGTRFDRLLRARTFQTGRQLAILLLLGLMGHDLLQHARLWRVENMGLLFPSTPVDIRTQVLTRVDPTYTGAILIGAVLALLAFLFLILAIRRESRQT